MFICAKDLWSAQALLRGSHLQIKFKQQVLYSRPLTRTKSANGKINPKSKGIPVNISGLPTC